VPQVLPALLEKLALQDAPVLLETPVQLAMMVTMVKSVQC
jgi:hypothetical protein